MKHRKQWNTIILAVIFMLWNFTTAANEGNYAFIGPKWRAEQAGMNIVMAQKKEIMAPSAPEGAGNIPDKQCADYWEVEYTRSGGFAGIMRQLKLSSSGRLLASDLKQKTHIEQQVPAEQLAEISGLLRRIDLSKAQKTHRDLSKNCADCFQHEYTVVVDGQRHKLSFDNKILEDPEYVQLIKILSSLMNQAFVKEKP